MTENTVEFNGQQLTRGDLLYEGKAKQVFATNDPAIIWMHYMDQVTALNGKVKEEYSGKGELNSSISNLLFTYLSDQGLQHHWLGSISATDELVKKVDIIPLEVVTRNYTAGHFVSRFGVEPMQKLSPRVQELYYKSDELDDPFMNDSQAVSLKFASEADLKTVYGLADQVNELLVALFNKIDITLIDYKLEFGRLADGQIILADELSPDNMRLVDQKTGKSLDKDVFRQKQGDLRVGYQDVLQRLQDALK
ncbi:phosphoribosylaminoimidazolesuccinocarboxamide synthase [Fructobacillus evanidus]|uniref:Phosphoribosylaminoimidazole-succinocarboxamide synthase n=1 Tax=Fructobacillus evanidus TaxID=3064281 RepID=A0ABM9MXX3_9LACO|nr:Phosphoribosylaminoimidazole-succinocarboxamide synthase (PurC) [Fructobacillus sp. LMG 32999]CAK1247194.1 Phosphoribosylaminoimidazole-succinocarboxamide synthase (PurC) [Fructobacillus sp. LMG 32999]CAK1248032.1 Phosphoribosylaminoimidazole-succinocarboxamide synthase (PurC) [Fructobacillus sp. LMG 32999]CAK1249154.1 Phosphoribosylaminoimidazole-succinocarboxamide synthase (PurC) [Fructobacillus sp. LMG 32999]CAK1253790.1 Phosphoribosylaminoimidazole-succinocarboxamide synthase (PurC) [Fru